MSQPSEWPRELPMFPLGSVVLPGVGVPLHVFESRYRALVMTCLTSDRLFGSVLIERGSEVGGGDVRADVGTLIRIVDAHEGPDGRWAVIGAGVERIRVLQWLDDDPFPRCVADLWPDDDSAAVPEGAIERTLGRIADLMIQLGGVGVEDRPALDRDPRVATHQLAALAPIGLLDRLDALRASGPDQRLRLVDEALTDQFQLLAAMRDLDGPDRPT